jgi:hypothetical protein
MEVKLGRDVIHGSVKPKQVTDTKPKVIDLSKLAK